MNKELVNTEEYKTLEQSDQIVDRLTNNEKATEEEFQNFMHTVTEVEKIVKMLASPDSEEQKHGEILADDMLNKRSKKEFSEIEDLKVKNNRTLINKYPQNTPDSGQMSQEAFMRSVERDAKERAEGRKIRNERAETLKSIGNGAFKEGDYEKAVTYFSKALEQRKDSSVLWNNRALSYMNLKLYEKALHDLEWALKVNDSNIKALLNTAKCYKYLRNERLCATYIESARKKQPHLKQFIDDFQKDMEAKFNIKMEQE